MTGKINRISKSQYLKGIQCPKALWLYRHRPDLRPEISESLQHLFDMGHEIGELAQKRFGMGTEITEEYYQIDEAIKSTQRAIEQGEKIIFEATACSEDGAYSKIDILKKVKGSDDWDLIEVKSSTGVKGYHLDDMALQRYAFMGAGYKIRKSILMHINNQYVRSGELDLNQLFHLEDCTKIVNGRQIKIEEDVGKLLEIVNDQTEPSIEIGDHCSAPFSCDYIDYCWQHIPDYSVYNLFKGSKLDELRSKDILEVSDIPSGFEATGRQRIEIDSVKQNRIYKAQDRINEFLDSLVYPLYYLDYETINPGVPLFDSSRPYQLIPFQFSLHIQSKKGGALEHKEFLYTNGDDPRPDFISALIGDCDDKGSVIVYNKGFESRVNNELAFDFPDNKDKLDAIADRMVDLLVPFRSRYLYHPEMRGSASLKSVLPAFVSDLGYDDLEISDGADASIRYLSCIKDYLPESEKNITYDDLKKYCTRDTMAEVELIKVLYESVK